MYNQPKHFNQGYHHAPAPAKVPVKVGKIQTDRGFYDVFINEDRERVPLMQMNQNRQFERELMMHEQGANFQSEYFENMPFDPYVRGDFRKRRFSSIKKDHFGNYELLLTIFLKKKSFHIIEGVLPISFAGFLSSM